jgi:hypothetical protein
VSDPTRLAEDGGDALALERELLRAGRAARLPAREREQVWSGLSSALTAPVLPRHAGPGAGVAATSAAGAKALTGAAILKGTMLAVVLGGGAFVGYRATRLAAEPVVHPASPTARVAPPAPAAPTAPAVVPEAPKVDGPAPARAPRRPAASRLAAESRVVLEARRALRDGHPDDALRTLEAARAPFADGALAQEREALAIEALAHAGHPDAASARAAAFLRAYPGSPHAASVRTFVVR